MMRRVWNKSQTLLLYHFYGRTCPIISRVNGPVIVHQVLSHFKSTNSGSSRFYTGLRRWKIYLLCSNALSFALCYWRVNCFLLCVLDQIFFQFNTQNITFCVLNKTMPCRLVEKTQPNIMCISQWNMLQYATYLLVSLFQLPNDCRHVCAEMHKTLDHH